MNIKKEQLKTLWYEDKDGNEIVQSDEALNLGCPEGAVFQVSQFPRMLRTTHLQLIAQEDVDKCKHPRKYIKPTYGWIDGIVGRECKACHGTQTKKKWHLWPRKWDGYGSREIIAFNSGWSEGLVLAMTNSGDYTLSEAIIIAARSCERCMNSLAYKYGLSWGYEEYSEEWQKCGTSCKFCEE
jgi:hypothetical protein